MKDYGIVQGSSTQAVPLIIGIDTAYVHTDITPALDDSDQPISDMFSYREIQYTKDEYIALISKGLADADAINIDQEYRLTLVELGV